MSVRKRTWITAEGEQRAAWLVDYRDATGKRRFETFDRKKDADEYHDKVRGDVRQGIHTPKNKSITVAAAAEDWLSYVKLEERERSTLEQYQQHVKLHIVPRIGGERLANLTQPRLEKFRDELVGAMSRPMAKKVLTSLKSILRDAKRRGNVAQNVAGDVKVKLDKRGKKKLRVGVDVPMPDEIRQIIGAASDEDRPLLMTATFAGLRSSELRGLKWSDVDLKAGEIHVKRRADRWNKLGATKSASGTRTIPIGPIVVNALREWKLRCPKGELGLVFPNGAGKFENHSNLVQRILGPTQIAAGVVDKAGKAKYPGLHTLRHFFASWCLARPENGGLGLTLNEAKERLGHSSIAMTADTYGHMLPSQNGGKELAQAERLLLG
jgi:integrase